MKKLNWGKGIAKYYEFWALLTFLWAGAEGEKFQLFSKLKWVSYRVETSGFFCTLQFYVKSILVDFRRSKTAIFTILATMNLSFKKLLQSKMWYFQKSQLSKPPNMLKWQFLSLWNQSKLIAHKILSGRKISILLFNDGHTVWQVLTAWSEIWTSGEKWWYCFLSSFISRSLRIPSCRLLVCF